MSASSLNISVGTLGFPDNKTLGEALDLLKEHGVDQIDTANIYTGNETNLGLVDAAGRGFALSSKNGGGFVPGKALTPEGIPSGAKYTADELKIKQLDIYYIHAPDRSTSVDVWMPLVQKLYDDGFFRRFGLSNFTPEEVREVYDYNKKNNYVLPTVFQGSYNPVSRGIEQTLFPVLRELNIAFYAYSPIGGGFLVNTRQGIESSQGSSRFGGSDNSVSQLYQSLYLRPGLLDFLDKWNEIAAAEGVPKAELAYRWVYFNSSLQPKEHNDHIILGASKISQLKGTLEGLERGPLSAKAVKAIDEAWTTLEKSGDAIINNFDRQSS